MKVKIFVIACFLMILTYYGNCNADNVWGEYRGVDIVDLFKLTIKTNDSVVLYKDAHCLDSEFEATGFLKRRGDTLFIVFKYNLQSCYIYFPEETTIRQDGIVFKIYSGSLVKYDFENQKFYVEYGSLKRYIKRKGYHDNKQLAFESYRTTKEWIRKEYDVDGNIISIVRTKFNGVVTERTFGKNSKETRHRYRIQSNNSR